MLMLLLVLLVLLLDVFGPLVAVGVVLMLPVLVGDLHRRLHEMAQGVALLAGGNTARASSSSLSLSAALNPLQHPSAVVELRHSSSHSDPRSTSTTAVTAAVWGGSSSGGGGGLGTAAASTTTNPVEFHGYNAGPGSSPDDVIEKYYYYWHCRRVQEHSLVLEKSAWCMLPPPLNLCAVGYYIPHVYLGWRARLRFDVDITVSWGGYVTDTVLFLLVLVPCGVYEDCLKH
eukprot:gene28729-37061_t